MCYWPFGGLNRTAEVLRVRKMLSILITGVFVLALSFSQVAAFGAAPTGAANPGVLPLVPQGDDNGGASVYGVPPLVPQGDDNGGASVYGVPPLVPQGDDNGGASVYGVPPLVPQFQGQGE
jgi:hypothetical protein